MLSLRVEGRRLLSASVGASACAAAGYIASLKPTWCRARIRTLLQGARGETGRESESLGRIGG